MLKKIMEHFSTIRELEFQRKKKVEECLFATGGKKEINNSLNTRKSGSAALDMAYVGAGRYDGYFQRYLNIWDIAAGIIIVKEAGGEINDVNCSTIKDHEVFAASNAVYEKMIENLNNF